MVKIKTRGNKTLNSQMEVGNAPNARTTISREGRTATDVRNLEPSKMLKVNLFISLLEMLSRLFLDLRYQKLSLINLLNNQWLLFKIIILKLISIKKKHHPIQILTNRQRVPNHVLKLSKIRKQWPDKATGFARDAKTITFILEPSVTFVSSPWIRTIRC